MALVTPPSATADSYVSLADAVAYFAARPTVLINAAWTAAADAQKEAGLIAATQVLEREDWKGSKTNTFTENALRWPRANVETEDGGYWPSTSVPAPLKNAVAELAALILAGTVGGAGESESSTTSAVSAVSVGEISIDYDTAVAGATSGYDSGYSSTVDLLIAPFIRNTGGMARLVRG
ncbi:MAG: hypothetical protein Q8N51_00875 [Gammaproteobacteria bacterium]|nr:hypothetical protein [Gammaproteobacteria bacterium]